ncbi:MAG: AEC family transporter [Desulfovibrionaceae bacterium]|nr:AEC family transporter [Desulfovibrionaceae bacterium]
MENFILIFLCLGFGKIARRLGLLPPDAFRTINVWVLYVAIPAMALRLIPYIEWGIGMILPVIAPFLLWVLAWLYTGLYARVKKLDNAARVVLLLGAGLGNTAFMGFPLVTAFYGLEGMVVPIVYDMSCFILFCTVGTIVVLNAAMHGEGRKVRPQDFLRRIFTFPPSLAIICALILPSFADISFLNPLLDKIIPTVAPMAMFSIGLQLEFGGGRQYSEPIAAALLFKLILSPTVILVLALLAGTQGLIAQVSVLQAGMGAHVTASLMASQFNLNPRLSGLVVAFSIIGALSVTPFWWWIMRGMF